MSKGTSIQEQLFNYREALQEVTFAHAKSMGNIAVRHQDGLHEAIAQRVFESRIRQTGSLIEKRSKDTYKKVDDTIYNLGQEAMRGLLSRTDTQVLEEVWRIQQIYGDHPQVDREIRYGATNQESGDAIKATLDYARWQDIQKTADIYGVDFWTVANKTRNASSHEASDAFEAGLDSLRWQDVLQTAETYGPDSWMINNKVRTASSDEARSKMEEFLLRPKPREERSYEHRTTQEQAAKEARDRAKWRAEQERQWDTRGQQSRSQSRQDGRAQSSQPPRQPRQEAGQKQDSPRVARAQEIIGQMADSDRRLSWLKNTDIMEVVKVINTIESARKKAEAAGKTVTDTQMYLRYRQRLETDAENEQYDLSFKIIDALMGGNYKGTLPF